MRVHEFSQQLLQATRSKWGSQIENVRSEHASAIASDYEVILGWIGDNLQNPEKYQHAHPYGLVEEDEDYARTVLKITRAAPYSGDPWLKVLDVYLSPRLDIRNREDFQEDQARRAERHISLSLTEVIRLTHEELPADKVKIYRRDEHMEQYLDEMVERLQERGDTPNVDTKRYGAWLEIENISV